LIRPVFAALGNAGGAQEGERCELTRPGVLSLLAANGTFTPQMTQLAPLVNIDGSVLQAIIGEM